MSQRKKSPRIVPFPGSAAWSRKKMIEEIEISLARIDADITRVLSAVEPKHYSDQAVSRKLEDIEALGEMRAHQILRTEAGL